MMLAFIASPVTPFTFRFLCKGGGMRCAPSRPHWTLSYGNGDVNENIPIGRRPDISYEPQIPPKRKRGRPKGSKNRKSGNGRTGSGVMPLRAPNGLPGSGPEDLLPELLPLLAQQEIEEMEEETPDEIAARVHLEDLMADFSARSRQSERLQSLRPYALREDAIVCDACNGDGMVTCSYCKGEGFVDFGENNEKFHDDFPDGDMTLPKHVMENIYHCPMCGGLQKERCIKCLGVGELEDAEASRTKGASRSSLEDKFWERMNFDTVLAEVGDRVEVGVDGLMIVRAPSRKGRGGRPRKKKPIGSENNDQTVADKSSEPVNVIISESETPDANVNVKKKRGRPRKTQVNDLSVDHTASGTSSAENEGSMTNTTKPVPTERKIQTMKKRGRPPKSEERELDSAAPRDPLELPVTGSQLELREVRGRGRPPKSSLNESTSRVEQRSTGARFPKKKDEQPSTDFINTTDYQVGRQLRKLTSRNKPPPKDS